MPRISNELHRRHDALLDEAFDAGVQAGTLDALSRMKAISSIVPRTVTKTQLIEMIEREAQAIEQTLSTGCVS